jgi:magnesium transporter
MNIDNLLIQNFNTPFSDIIHNIEYQDIFVFATDDIKVVSRKFEEYNLQVIPVIDKDGKMLGRITSDDAYDIISEIATEQVYNMAGVDDEVEEENNLKEIVKTRAYWLFLNLFTAVLASFVISIFDETLAQFIPLAILMPIVASMGGNAGTQTLTVVVRQLALGEIENGDGKNAVKREVIISIINGFLFATTVSIITYIWFGNVMLGVVIASAMIVNLFIAGLFGSLIPLLLQKLKIDPAIGSTVLLTTATDIFGFFAFLGLAKLILV